MSEDTSRLQKIFISHATPEDNYFAGWLASKLSLQGYEVWCDLEQLMGGEDFWYEVESTIRTQSAKFIFVITETSIAKNGTRKELAVADKIRDRGDFIIPVRIENVSGSSLPVELIRLTYIDFYENGWANGLHQLLDKLEKDKVYSTSTAGTDAAAQFWRNALSLKEDILIQREELYRTNWFEFRLPEHFYLHFPPQLAPINLDTFRFLTFLEGDYVISFACENCFQEAFPGSNSVKIETSKIIKDIDFVSPTSNNRKLLDGNKKVIRLLNSTFANFLLSKGLLLYQLATDTIYYFPKASETSGKKNKVDLKKFGRRSIQLTGKSFDLNWHFAIGAQAFLYPLSAYAVDYHVIFTSEIDIPPKEVQHKHRRHLSKSWYNKKWRDLLLGAFLWLQDEDNNASIQIPLCKHNAIELNTEPIMFASPMGYNEPKPQEDEEQDEQ
jgi:hypothetical protein